ncbi:MAG: hypothetical protein HZB14_03095 [Actinobacteria bacterium]|nr:hypothetical protein [Actinomycetota bacterium]
MQNRDFELEAMTAQPKKINYVVDPEAVAEAIIRRVAQMADERVMHRRSLICSVEVLVPRDYDGPALPV